MTPIGVVRSPRVEVLDDDWGAVVTTCELVQVRGRTGGVRGLDGVDGSPVLDLEPYMTEFAPRGKVRQPAWSRELMERYW